MIAYKVIHHVPGRIRIGVPFIKNIPLSNLTKLSNLLSAIPIPAGIKDIRPSPFSGSVVITYEPGKIDIIEYIKTLASSTELQKLIGGQDLKKTAQSALI